MVYLSFTNKVIYILHKIFCICSTDAQAAWSSKRRKKVGRFTDFFILFEYGNAVSQGIDLESPLEINSGQNNNSLPQQEYLEQAGALEW